ncbi:MAG: DUF2334 domain-containing protein, partial [Thermoleophilia bacterium]|nr:DUF2334 domain-containing protein [Thermoleophilia bacterium]
MKLAILVLMFVLGGVMIPALPAAAQPAAQTAVLPAAQPDSQPVPPLTQARTSLIVYDSGTDIAQARILQDLLGHFEIESTAVSEGDYEPGSLAGYDITFYINHDGHRQDRPVPDSLLDDIARSTRTVVWMGFGFNQLAKKDSMERYGYTFSQSYMQNDFDSVYYKDRKLTKRTPAAELVTITDPRIASVYSTIGRGALIAPYIVRGGNLWHIADVPLDDLSQYSAYVVFSDLLHDMVRSDHVENQLALIRLEDVHPGVDQEQLRAAADYLFSRDIPFSIALIPVYKNQATGVMVSLSDKPDFVETIRYMQARGGEVVLHGYTHQYSGETAVDYEFWNNDVSGPIDGESEGWIKKRMMLALDECWKNDIFPIAWVTPHYKASDFTNAVIARNIPVYYGRRDQTFFPYIIYRD